MKILPTPRDARYSGICRRAGGRSIPQLESAWYRVEVLIFERTGAADANAVEVLGSTHRIAFRGGATAFVEDERTRALASSVDPANARRTCLPQP
jgi:hypothetical protein